MKYQVFVSLIAYVNNGSGSVGEFLKKYDACLAENFDSFEIIIVNDGSTDGTQAEIEEATKGLKGNMILINLPWKHGVEPAMTAGLHKSVGDFVFETDTIETDFDAGMALRLYETAVSGYDIVTAAPTTSQSLASHLFYKFINRASYVNMNMSTETFRLVSRRALNAMLNLKEKFRYRKALYMLTGYPKYNIGYAPLQRSRKRYGQENFDLALDVIIGYSHIGIKTIHLFSALLFLFSAFIAAYTLYSYFILKDVVRGWSTIMLFLSIVFSGLFFILGILGEYILRILNEVMGRPYYTVSSVKVFSETANSAKAPDHELIPEVRNFPH